MSRQIAVDASRASVEAITGTERYSREIIRAMIAISPRPALTLYHRTRWDIHLNGEGVTHRVISIPRLWTHAGLSAAIARQRPCALFVPSHVIPLIHPRATVVTVHDLGYRVEPDSHPRSQRLMLDATTRWNVRVARRVIAISGQTRDDLINHYGVSPDKVRVIHSGVDLTRFSTAPTDDLGTLLERQIRPPYLLFLSTVHPRKNVIRLIEAFESLDRDDLQLVIAGKSGWLSDPIEARIRSSPAAPRILRLNHLPDDVIPALYNRAEAFVLPSLYEGFGMGVLEAMASGCPVVTSNRSSLPEVAGDAAVLVDPYDVRSIRDGIRAAVDRDHRPYFVQAGQAHASGFTWQRAANQTLAAIEDAVHDRE